jgi:hypothetical protein
LDGCEQFLPQGRGFAPLAAPRPPPAPAEIKNQQAQENKGEPQAKRQEELFICEESAREAVVVPHIRFVAF